MVQHRVLALIAVLCFSPVPAAAQDFKPRTIDLKGIEAKGASESLPTRTIDLKPVTASGATTKINKTFQLTGWTASPPPRGKRF
jgi:hypothetical protein